MRYDIRLKPDDVRTLDRLCELESLPRAAVIRRALRFRLEALAAPAGSPMEKVGELVERVLVDDEPPTAVEVVQPVFRALKEGLYPPGNARRAQEAMANAGVKLMTADELEEQRRREENPFE